MDKDPNSIRQYLKPNQVAQEVQLLQDGTSIRAVTRTFGVSPSKGFKSMEKILGDGPLEKESWTGLWNGNNRAAGPVSVEVPRTPSAMSSGACPGVVGSHVGAIHTTALHY